MDSSMGEILLNIVESKGQSRDQVLDSILMQGARLLSATSGEILINDGDKLVVIQSSHGNIDEHTTLNQHTSSEITKNKSMTSKKGLIPDTAVTGDLEFVSRQFGGSDQKTELVIPLVIRREAIGVIRFERIEGPTFTPASIAKAEELAMQAAYVLKMSEELDRMERLRNAEQKHGYQRIIAQIIHSLAGNVGLLRSYSRFALQSLTDQSSSNALASDIRKISEATDRMVEELITLRKDLEEMDAEVIDVNEVVMSAVEGLPVEIDLDNITLSLNLTDGLPKVRSNRALVHVFTNLLINALDAFPNSHGAISVTTQPRDAGVQITVKDTGIGIPKSLLPFVFETLFTSKGTDQARSFGSGLGLFWVQHFLNSYDGTISVNSSIDSGTTFTIWLPKWRD